MKRLISLAVVASMAVASGAYAKTVTYIETVTRADGTKIITITKVYEPSNTKATRASLQQALLRSNLR